ncbi:hypothetical protein ACA910_009369 [Epithemia clementina (nom. ined.)]
MNLELLDPFGRQIPDRVDATLPLAPHLHFRYPNHHLLAAAGASSPQNTTASSKKGNKGDNSEQHNRHSNSTNVNTYALNAIGTGLSESGGTIPGVLAKREVPEWRAAYHVSYNRRGTYLAVGYGSGAVAIHSTSTRTLAALYRSSAGGPRNANGATIAGGTGGARNSDGGVELLTGNGVTSVSWSRRSRTLLTGAAGDAAVHLYDTTHPFGPEEAGLAIDDRGQPNDENENGQERASTSRPRTPQVGLSDYEQRDHIPPIHSKERTGSTLFADPPFDELKYVFVKEKLQLESINVPMGTKVPQHVIDSFAMPSESDDEHDEGEEQESDDNDGKGEDHNKKEKKRKKKKRKKKKPSTRDARLNKHPCISFSFQNAQAVGGSLQINPRCPTGGLAALRDGSLVLFWFDPLVSWITQVQPKDDKKKGPEFEHDDEADKGKDIATKRPPKYAIVVPLWSQTVKHFITCAAFDPQGERVYAATKDGMLLGFEVKLLFESLAASSPNYKGSTGKTPKQAQNSNVAPSPIKGGLPLVAPHFKLGIPGGASAWHLLVSRNGKYLVLNSGDGALRLYSTNACWTNERKGKQSSSKSSSAAAEKPTWTFQDVVSKVKFVSCDLSGDGEYVVGGANGNDNRYELSIWNTTTGNLMDKLTGPAVQLYSVAWHPTRASLAVATSDGLVDVWGPKMNWTAFAPDFQALHKNIVYEEEDGDADDEKETEKTAMQVEDMAMKSSSNGPHKADGKTVSFSGSDKNGDLQGNGAKGFTKAAVKQDSQSHRNGDDRREDSKESPKGSKSSNSNKKGGSTTARGKGEDKIVATNGAAMKREWWQKNTSNNSNWVDVITKDPVPMFASDSEKRI